MLTFFNELRLNFSVEQDVDDGEILLISRNTDSAIRLDLIEKGFLENSSIRLDEGALVLTLIDQGHRAIA